jgi:hypothetical protein
VIIAFSTRARREIFDFGHYGFILRYRVRAADIIITRVLHGRQNR